MKTYSLGLVPLGTTPPPKYALDVILGANTLINYGSYANRQRRELQAFFFPVDRVEQPISREPQPGERRIHTMFDISVSLSSPAQFNIPFSFQNTLHQIHIALGTQSLVSVHVPWVTGDNGSRSVVKGELQNVCVESSLPYKSLGNAGLISFTVNLDFPRVWNGLQTWDMHFSGSAVQANIMFAYIDFVNGEFISASLASSLSPFLNPALLDDWLGSEPNDLYNFVPVNWIISLDLSAYEIFLFTNRYNWLDLVGPGVENTQLAFCGSTGQIRFELPFVDYIPLKQKVYFSAKVNICCVYK